MTDDKRSEEKGSEATDSKRRKQRLGTGVAVGIGSAAIVAALLYANRNRRSDRERND